jgi:hypothetical protein
METEIVLDGTLADNQTQIQELWSWREGITEVLGHEGGVYKYDLSIPISELYDIVNDTRDRLTEAGLVGDGPDYPVVDVVGYGHMGDANLHLNIPTRRFDKAVEKQLEPFVYEWVQKRNGSISAEHGLGVTKKPYVSYSKNETMMKLMKQIKDLYDPVSGYPLTTLTCTDSIVEGHHEPLQVHLSLCRVLLDYSYPSSSSKSNTSSQTRVLSLPSPLQQFLRVPLIYHRSLLLVKQTLQPALHPLSKHLHKLRLREWEITSIHQPLVSNVKALHERLQLPLSTLIAIEHESRQVEVELRV